MVKADLDLAMMVMEEADLIMAAADHVQDSRDHAHHLLVERMADLVAHHLDPLQVDLEEEGMEEHLRQA
jgi:hypothetical protein